MTKFDFQITVPANSPGGAPIQLAVAAIAAGAIIAGYQSLYSASYLPCCKFFAQMATGGTGQGFIGGSKVTSAGVDVNYTLEAASGKAPGDLVAVDSYQDYNALDLSTFNAHGAVPGDKINITYYQA